MPASLRLTLLLCRLKFTLLINSLKNWASVGKTLGIAATVVLTAVVITDGASDVIQALRMLPYADIMLVWLLGGLITYVIFIVFTGDLITGHSLNTGQMSSDFGYLRTLPVPPFSLIAVKLFERVITDYLGLIILFSTFLGIACRDFLTLESVLLAIALYLQISLLVGLLINLCTIFLTRFFRTTTINNFFSLLGYFSAFLTLAPYLILSNFPHEIIELIVKNLDILNATVFRFLLPVQWMAVSLLSASFCDEFFYFSAFWAVCMVTGSMIFYMAINQNWYSFSHSTARRTESSGKRWFRGLYHKEALLLKSDFNLLINALLMPLSLIVLEIFFLKEVFNFSTSTSVLNFVAGSIVYFCMFGPVSSIGYEGKAISLLESLPLSPGALLLRKTVFWSVIAEIVFIPATVITMYQLNFPAGDILAASINTAFLTIGCVLAAVNVSAIFPNFESKILQQRSTIVGKLAAIGMMLILIPVKSPTWPNLYSLIIFICIIVLATYKARTMLYFRLDKQAQCSEGQKLNDVLLMFLAFAGCEATITQFLHSIIPGVDTGMWNWFITAAIFLPVSSLLLLSHRQGADPKTVDEGNPPVSSAAAWFLSVILAALTVIVGLKIHNYRPLAAALFRDDVFQIMNLAATLSLPPIVWQSLLTAGIAALGAVLVCHVGRRFPCNGSGATIRNITAVALITLVAPPALMPTALLTATAIVVCNSLTTRLRYGIAIGAMASAAQAIFFIFF